MAYVVTERCVNDTSCIGACPVDCIRPTPGDPEFSTAEMLYVDPDTCISCGACADACPVDAIHSEDELISSLSRFRELNAGYFQQHPLRARAHGTDEPRAARRLLRVAIVGAGPSACYAAEALLAHGNVEVEIIDRLPTPWGLVRHGVAPDHQDIKKMGAAFERALADAAFGFHLNVEVSRHVQLDELRRYHHAVTVAVGAATDRTLDIPGEDLRGSHAASEFIAWYNGHPDYADHVFDLSGERAVIVGNGNVALDIARVLTARPEDLARTDISDHALEALRASSIREVVILGRRGTAQAAYTSPEFMALGNLPGVDVVVRERDLEFDDISRAEAEDPAAEHWLRSKVALAREYARNATQAGNKKIVFRYFAAPDEILGTDQVRGIRIARTQVENANGKIVARRTDETQDLACSLVIRSIGHRGKPIAHLPFDFHAGVIPNDSGRVIDGTDAILGTYVTGWIKRGANGVIGTNRMCARETVNCLLDDFEAGLLPEPESGRAELQALIHERQPYVIERAGWESIDRAERQNGLRAGRPRVKFTDRDEMVAAAHRRSPTSSFMR